MKPKDITGERFGRLVAESIAGRTRQGSVTWICRCDCGGKKIVSSASLRSGGTRSCGCLSAENLPPSPKKHGCSSTRTPEYNAWRAMRERCLSPKSAYYHLYGGAGVTICTRWEEFANFLADMGLKPTPEHSLDRRDSRKGYSPDNCRWACKSTQSFNRARCKGSSGIIGVYKANRGCWQASLKFNGEYVLLETHSTLLDAAAARISAENKFRKERGL